MEKKDLEQIGDLFNKAFGQIWESNLEPTLTQIQGQMVTRSYLDDKLSELEGGLVVKLKKEDQKVNRLAEILRQKNLISESDIQELGHLVVFPK